MVNPCYWASVSIGDSENFSENSERERQRDRETERQRDRETETRLT